jgi:Ca-activated chloride channel family protein
MKWTLVILLAFISGNNPKDIARINGLKKQAEEAFLKENYEAAATYYHTLIDSLSAEDDELYLNLAHSYFQQGDSAQARTYYGQASTTDNKTIKSIAYQQLGVMAKEGQQYEESLNYLKSSIKADPTNQDARYDYELVKKLLEEQQQQQQQQQDQQNKENEEQQEEQKDDQQQEQENQNGEKEEQENQEQQEQEQNQQDQQDQDGQEQEQQQQEGEEQEEQQDPQDMSTKEKLEEMNISEEKARMILEAMKNSEIQYLQQQKRKATKRPESGKPDW